MFVLKIGEGKKISEYVRLKISESREQGLRSAEKHALGQFPHPIPSPLPYPCLLYLGMETSEPETTMSV